MHTQHVSVFLATYFETNCHFDSNVKLFLVIYANYWLMTDDQRQTETLDPMGNSHKNLLVWNQLLNWNQTLIKQSLDGPLPKLCLVVPPSDQDGCTAELSLTYMQDPMGNSHKKHLVWNQQLNQNQTDGIVIGWSSSKIVSGSRALPPRWLPQCSCVVIENNFDPGERLQAPGSLWFYYFLIRKSWMGEYQ